MGLYEFNIQSITKVKIEAESKLKARMKLIEEDDLYYEDLLNDVYIDEGKLIET